MAPKPSHLEAVDPVVMGLVKVLWQRLACLSSSTLGVTVIFTEGNLSLSLGSLHGAGRTSTQHKDVHSAQISANWKQWIRWSWALSGL